MAGGGDTTEEGGWKGERGTEINCSGPTSNVEKASAAGSGQQGGCGGFSWQHKVVVRILSIVHSITGDWGSKVASSPPTGFFRHKLLGLLHKQMISDNQQYVEETVADLIPVHCKYWYRFYKRAKQHSHVLTESDTASLWRKITDKDRQ